MCAKSINTWIAGYAALIATFSLGWNIVNSIKQNKSKIKVSVYIQYSFYAIPGIGTVGNPTWQLTIDIISNSKHKKYIEQPILELPEEIDVYGNKIKSTNRKNIEKYPQMLEFEQKFETIFALDQSLLEIINRISNINKQARILVKDTNGKKYYSNKIQLKVLKEYCEKNLLLAKAEQKSQCIE